MRPGLPDPLISLLGARWTMGAPVRGAAWLGTPDAVGFALADGTMAIARAKWDGAPKLQSRQGGGVELVPPDAPPPPVMRAGVHDGPCLDVTPDPSGGALSAGADGAIAHVDVTGRVEVVARFADPPARVVAARPNGARACTVGSRVYRLGQAPSTIDLPDVATALAFDPTGRVLAIGIRNALILWSSDGTQRYVEVDKGTPGALAWSADGQIIVGGLRECSTRAWHLPDLTELAMGDYPTPPLSLSFSIPAGFLATSGDERVVCWSLETTPRRAQGGVASTVPVCRVACHPSRPVIAAGYQNGAVLLCQRDTTDVLFVREAGGGAVAALAWSDDGAFLALGTEAGEIGVVAFPDQLFRRADVATPAAPEQRTHLQ